MAKGPTLIRYENLRFSDEKLQIIAVANEIIERYQEQGFSLTLRQLYYQFVAKRLFANSDKNYNMLGDLISRGRMAGLVDWEAIVDRTRFLRELQTWKSPADAVGDTMRAYARNKWATQQYRPYVRIEKDALIGVIAPICNRLQVPYSANRGYISQSEQWRAARRMCRQIRRGHTPIVFHLGDHDPSGIDMTRDDTDRLNLFVETETGQRVEIRRLALNMDQIQRYQPPPNPLKVKNGRLSDSRAQDYLRRYGRSSWELDALDPPVIAGLIRAAVLEIRDEALWKVEEEQEKADRAKLKDIWISLGGKPDPDAPPAEAKPAATKPGVPSALDNLLKKGKRK